METYFSEDYNISLMPERSNRMLFNFLEGLARVLSFAFEREI